MSHLGNCGRCKQWRYLTHGFCPECQKLLQAWRIKEGERLRAEREQATQAKMIEQFAGQLDQPDEAIWADLGFRGD